MKKHRTLRACLLVAMACLAVAGCRTDLASALAATATSTGTDAPTSTPTRRSTWTVPPTFTPTATLTLTPTWALRSGKIVCPILLYHRIDTPPDPNSGGARYFVPPDVFAQQMKALKDWGYTSIPLSLLVQAIAKGAALPEHPVVITFDDGDESVFKNAFPIMKEYGFTGMIYIVGNRLNAEGFMNADQITRLASRGWEVGSHSMSHIDLTLDHGTLMREIYLSKQRLESVLKIHIDSFSYPFATIDPVIAQKVYESGYTNAVGVGTLYAHDRYDLYYLSRIEIRYDYTLDKIASILPWPGPAAQTSTP